MEIKYIYAKINGIQPTISFLKVIAIQTIEGKVLREREEIASLLYGHDTVCTGNIPELKKDEDVVLKIQIQNITKADSEDKFPFIRITKIFTIPQVIPISNVDLSIGYINPKNKVIVEYINSLEITTTKEFYLLQNKELYGPFKIEKSELLPQLNKEVKVFPVNTSYILKDLENEVEYYLGSLKEPIDLVDCMNNAQLMEFFKTKMAKTNEEKELFNKVKQFISESDDKIGLDQIRIERIDAILDDLIINEEEIDQILDNQSRWIKVFKTQVEQYETKLKKALKIDLSKELEDVNIVKSKIEAEINNSKQDLDALKTQLEIKSEELQKLIENKDTLIATIKLQSELNNNVEPKVKSFYDEIHYQNEKTESSLSFDEKLDLICDDDVDEKKTLEYFIESLATKSLFYCNNPRILSNYLKIFNEYKLIYQNVEPDWIKYQSLFENGLERSVKNAIESPDVLHVFILSDYNVAAFELYAKPIIDLVQNRRIYVPGTSFHFPNNLKIVLVESNISSQDDCFPSKIDLIQDNVAIINLEDLNFLKIRTKNKIDFTPLLWENQQ